MKPPKFSLEVEIGVAPKPLKEVEAIFLENRGWFSSTIWHPNTVELQKPIDTRFSKRILCIELEYCEFQQAE